MCTDLLPLVSNVISRDNQAGYGIALVRPGVWQLFEYRQPFWQDGPAFHEFLIPELPTIARPICPV